MQIDGDSSLIIIEPWTCGYIDTPETKEYKVNKQEYVKIRDSIYPSDHATVSGLLFDTYAIWASQLLNSKDIYLLNEQYIVKPPLSSSYSQFVWHRDSDYYHDTSIKNQMTVACWTALDDVNRVNGTVIVEDGHKGIYASILYSADPGQDKITSIFS
ncbi:unnamed protein product [Rhizopus microsporus]